MTTDHPDPRRAARGGAAAAAALDALTQKIEGPREWPADAGLGACMALAGRSLSRSWKPLAAVCGILMALQVVVVLSATTQFEAKTFSRLAEIAPEYMRRALGDLTLVMLSFPGVVCLGFFHPVFVYLVSLLGIYFGSEPAHDVESGAVDLLLARSLRRHWLVTRSLALIVVSTAAPLIAMALTMAIALRLFAPSDAPWPHAGSVARMGLNLAAVGVVCGALGLFVASRARRRGTAIAVAGIAVMFCDLLTLLEPVWAPARAIGWLSPFHFFHPLNVLAGHFEPWRDLLVLGAEAVALSAAAYWQFARRDL